MSVPLDFVVAIPARYGSSRLPGKPLAEIAGKPMIVHVAERALEAGATEVVVATDDARIAAALRGFPISVCMTSLRHASGTDRLAEAARQRGWEADRIVVNLQGDEPLAPPAAIRQLARTLQISGAPIATLAEPLDACERLFDPNTVKLVRNAEGDALYFSRAPLPWARDRFQHDRVTPLGAGGWLRHIGMYAYSAEALQRFAGMPAGRLEQIEALEQLRALEAGWRIAVALATVPIPAGVDTEDDLQRVRRLLEHGR